MSFPDFTYDLYEDFEDSTLASGLTESDADSIISFPDSAQKWLGSNSAKILHDGSSHDARFLYSPASKNNISCGFAWRTTATISTYMSGPAIFEVGYPFYSGVGIIRIYDGRDSGNNTRQFLIGFTGASNVEFKCTVSDNAWYWITVQYNRNGTSYVNIYNSSQTLIGEFSSGVLDYEAYFMRFGGSQTIFNTATYIDDIIIDYTNYNFPLLGWESAVVSSGSLVGQSALVGGGVLCGQGNLIN